MEHLFNINGLVFWNEEEIKLREYLTEYFAEQIEAVLWRENPAWRMVRIEAPQLMPPELLNRNYTSADVFFIPDDRNKNLFTDSGVVLRPETTPGSYVYAQHLLNTHTGHKPPLCVWQAGKSFRREPDQPSKHMRLKEFYQQEFQCIYASDTMNDYHSAILEPVRAMIGLKIGLPTRVVASDRLPSYSEITVDVEVDNGDKWMEVCSISRRTDFPQKLVFSGKKSNLEKDALVLEIAIGLDRVLYCHDRRR